MDISVNLLSALCLYSFYSVLPTLLPCFPGSCCHLPSSSQCSLCPQNPAKLLAVQLFLKPIRVTNLHVYNKVIPQDKPPYWGSCLLYLSAATDSGCVLRRLLGPGMETVILWDVLAAEHPSASGLHDQLCESGILAWCFREFYYAIGLFETLYITTQTFSFQLI